ncbi:6-bladed beta-propeller [Sphingobacterium thalpophilum]|uniref:6-bladed beta-propeller n=1 Tax=Sphingobacterium thalpophilum TaxID=259 RepID=A0ABV4HIN0_9SPHI
MTSLSLTPFGFCIILFGLGCSNSVNRSAAKERSDINVVWVYPDRLLSLKTSDFIASIQFVPLETTSESEFGEISQIEIIDGFYVILDRISNEILFFKKNGDFVRKISPKNQDIPIPYHYISKFSIDSNRGILYFFDLQSAYIYEFDLSGRFLNLRNKKPIDYKIRETYHLGKYTINYFSYESIVSDTKRSPAIIVNEGERKSESYLFFNPSVINYDDIYDSRKYFFKSEKSLLFSRPGDYNIYEFNKGRIDKSMSISLPEKFKLPGDFLSNNRYTGKRRKYLDVNSSKIYLITDVYKVGEMLSFKLVGSRYKGTFLHSQKIGLSIDFRNYLSDSSTYFLPIANNSILGVDGDRYISSVPAARIVQAITRNIKIGGYLSSLPANLLTFYKKGNHQNPVLTLIKPKNEIIYNVDN